MIDYGYIIMVDVLIIMLALKNNSTDVIVPFVTNFRSPSSLLIPNIGIQIS